jgi:hypothetical protein
VAVSFEQLIPSLHTVESFLFLKIFRVGNHCSTGVVILPPGEKKTRTNVRRNLLAFCVIQGKVEVTVNHSCFIAVKAGHFIVLPGVYAGHWFVLACHQNVFSHLSVDSSYELASQSDTDTILYFVHVVHPNAL